MAYLRPILSAEVSVTWALSHLTVFESCLRWMWILDFLFSARVTFEMIWCTESGILKKNKIKITEYWVITQENAQKYLMSKYISSVGLLIMPLSLSKLLESKSSVLEYKGLSYWNPNYQSGAAIWTPIIWVWRHCNWNNNSELVTLQLTAQNIWTQTGASMVRALQSSGNHLTRGFLSWSRFYSKSLLVWPQMIQKFGEHNSSGQSHQKYIYSQGSGRLLIRAKLDRRRLIWTQWR